MNYVKSCLCYNTPKYRLGSFFRSNGYFYETCGNVTAASREYYINRMQEKHWPVVVHKNGQSQVTNYFSSLEPSGL